MSQKQIIFRLSIPQIQRLYEIRDEILAGEIIPEGKTKSPFPRLFKKKIKEFGPKVSPWSVRGIYTQTALVAGKEGLIKTRQAVKDYAREYGDKAPVQEVTKKHKAEPRIVEEFKETQAYETLKKKYWSIAQDDITRHGKSVISTARNLWEWTDKTEPFDLGLEKFREIIKLPPSLVKLSPIFYSTKKDRISYSQLRNTRIIMALGGINPKLYDEFITTKSVSDTKTGWYLEEEELLSLVAEINTIDTLIYLMLGFAGGGRFSANMSLRADQVNIARGAITVFEGKTKKDVDKYYMPCQMELLDRYMSEFGKGDERIKGRIFKNPNKLYYKRLREAGYRAKLWDYVFDITEYDEKDKKRMLKQSDGRYKERKAGKLYYVIAGKMTSTHLLKHTFVSQSSLHGIPMEAISHMTGTTLKVLEQWYLGTKDVQAQQHYQGTRDFIPWDEWINKTIHPAFLKRYEEIFNEQIQFNGIKHVSEIKERGEAPLVA